MAKKSFLLRIDDQVHDALKCWADDELRSLNGQIEFLLRRALFERKRLKPHSVQDPEPNLGNESSETSQEGPRS